MTEPGILGPCLRFGACLVKIYVLTFDSYSMMIRYYWKSLMKRSVMYSGSLIFVNFYIVVDYSLVLSNRENKSKRQSLISLSIKLLYLTVELKLVLGQKILLQIDDSSFRQVTLRETVNLINLFYISYI
jgi:hypothetical protein